MRLYDAITVLGALAAAALMAIGAAASGLEFYLSGRYGGSHASPLWYLLAVVALLTCFLKQSAVVIIGGYLVAAFVTWGWLVGYLRDTPGAWAQLLFAIAILMAAIAAHRLSIQLD